jgi:hypothetical protein
VSSAPQIDNKEGLIFSLLYRIAAQMTGKAAFEGACRDGARGPAGDAAGPDASQRVALLRAVLQICPITINWLRKDFSGGGMVFRKMIRQAHFLICTRSGR